jgi:membrane-bound ClpP family serine protease
MEWLTLVLLLLFALALIVVEIIFIPGTSLFGIAGFILAIIGFWISFSALGTAAGFTVVASFVVLAGFTIYYSLKKRAWDRFALNTKISSRVNDERRFVLHVGETGHTLSALRPAGKAEFGNHVVEVHTLGNFVDVDQPVRVIRIDHNKVFVEAANIP